MNNHTNNYAASRRGGLAMRERATLRREVPDGTGDQLLDAAARRRLDELDRTKTRPWTPIRPRWIDIVPQVAQTQIDAYYATHPGGRVRWGMPMDDRDYARAAREAAGVQVKRLTPEQLARHNELARKRYAERKEQGR